MPFSAPALLAVEACCFPLPPALAWAQRDSAQGGPAEIHSENERVFFMRERGEVEISALCSL